MVSFGDLCAFALVITNVIIVVLTAIDLVITIYDKKK